MSDLSHLNLPQQEAVRTIHGPLLCLAGAGSGKTTVLTLRIAEIIESGVPPWKILAITFTNKAAAEIRDRLRSTIGDKANPDDVWACTFHAACMRILRREAELLGYPRSFTVYGADDQKRLLRSILKEQNCEEKRYPVGGVAAKISTAKNAELSPADFLKSGREDDHYHKMLAMVYRLYQTALERAGAMDFDDLIALTVRLFRENSDVLEHYSRRFQYILVDEYQDTNLLQYNLVAMLASTHRNLCVVGDDDQSIYKFRGATIENILNFEEQYPDAHVVRLEENYRSTGAILDAANSVIAHNKGRKGKTLRTSQGKGDAVVYHHAEDDNEESRYLTETILDAVKNGGDFGDHCILYRMNAQSNRIENNFRMSGVRYKVVGGMRFFDRAEILDIMAYLQVVINPNDDLRLMRIINTPARALGNRTQAIIRAMAVRDDRSCYDVICDAATYPELERATEKLGKFADLMLGLRDASADMPLSDFFDLVLKRTGYKLMLEEKNDEESRGRLENIGELKTNILQYTESAGEGATLAGFLDETALFTDLETLGEGETAVTLMTIHAAKGLEFPYVYVVGMEEGIFPSSRSLADPSDLEEERRLCYVAVTRARRKLTITTARQRMLFGATTHNIPARFIREMGLVAENNEQRTENRTKTGNGFAAPMRAKHEMLRARQAAPLPPPAGGYAVGATVIHKRFGKGVVLTATPMAGDALLEIAFEETGTKKLMQNTASKFLTAE